MARTSICMRGQAYFEKLSFKQACSAVEGQRQQSQGQEQEEQEEEEKE